MGVKVKGGEVKRGAVGVGGGVRAVVTEAAARCEVEGRDPLGCWSLCGQGPAQVEWMKSLCSQLEHLI